MKSKDKKTLYQGAISVKREVTLVPEDLKKDTDELRLALALVDRYKKAALRALKTTEKTADWTMIEYSVKTDCVIVTVDQGACG